MSGGKRKRNKAVPEAPKSALIVGNSHSIKPLSLTKWIKRLGVLLSLLVTASALLPLIQRPSVQTPTPIDVLGPLSVPYEITNESLLPLFSLKYDCEVLDLEKIDGGKWSNITMHRLAKDTPVLLSHQKVTADCERMVRGNFGIRSADIRVSISYFHFLWPFRWTSQYTFSALTSPDGKVLRWLPR